PLGEVLAEHGFTTDAEGKAKWQVNLGVGVYRAMLETQDRFGKKVTAQWPIQVLNPSDTKMAIKIPHVLEAPAWSVEPGDGVVAEMVATLYDASLDQFMPFYWQQRFGVFRQDHSTASAVFENSAKQFQWLRGLSGFRGRRDQRSDSVDPGYREFPYDLAGNFWGYEAVQSRARYGLSMRGAAVETSVAPPPAFAFDAAALAAEPMKMAKAEAHATPAGGAMEIPARTPPGAPDVSQVTARKNLNETAFFFPQLVSDSNGVVRMTFTMPEALTEWKFMGFGHDRNLRSGYW